MRPVFCKDISSCATDESYGSFGAPCNSDRIVSNCYDVTDPVAEIVAAPELYWRSMVQCEFRQSEAVYEILAVLRKSEEAFMRRNNESYRAVSVSGQRGRGYSEQATEDREHRVKASCVTKKGGDRTASKAWIDLDYRDTILADPEFDMSWSFHVPENLDGTKRLIFDCHAQPGRNRRWYIMSDFNEMRQRSKVFSRYADDLAIENLDGILLAGDIRHKKSTRLNRAATHVLRCPE
ncbi:hypothetical protein ACVIIV_003237 [Bradyrhizobium sp. USDA 4354]